MNIFMISNPCHNSALLGDIKVGWTDAVATWQDPHFNYEFPVVYDDINLQMNDFRMDM